MEPKVGGAWKHLCLARGRGRGLLVLGVLGVAVAVGVSRLSGQERARDTSSPVHPLAVDGHRWAEMGSKERVAFLTGFLAGAAAGQATELAGEAGEPEKVAAEMADLQMAQRLRFPFAASVYLARLEDYYFYRDRRDRPVAVALIEINRRLIEQNF